QDHRRGSAPGIDRDVRDRRASVPLRQGSRQLGRRPRALPRNGSRLDEVGSKLDYFALTMETQMARWQEESAARILIRASSLTHQLAICVPPRRGAPDLPVRCVKTLARVRTRAARLSCRAEQIRQRREREIIELRP